MFLLTLQRQPSLSIHLIGSAVLVPAALPADIYVLLGLSLVFGTGDVRVLWVQVFCYSVIWSKTGLDYGNIYSGRTLSALLDIERNPIAFIKGLKTGRIDA